MKDPHPLLGDACVAVILRLHRRWLRGGRDAPRCRARAEALARRLWLDWGRELDLWGGRWVVLDARGRPVTTGRSDLRAIVGLSAVCAAADLGHRTWASVVDAFRAGDAPDGLRLAALREWAKGLRIRSGRSVKSTARDASGIGSDVSIPPERCGML